MTMRLSQEDALTGAAFGFAVMTGIDMLADELCTTAS
jgi:hypothetical protein